MKFEKVVDILLRIANPDKDSTTTPSWYELSTIGVTIKDARHHVSMFNVLVTDHNDPTS